MQRKVRKMERDDHEGAEKAKVRRRDKGCRFPYCGCRKLRLRLEVSHAEHKGAGGNPKGDRSMASKMVQVCAERHKDNPISIDKGSLRWVPMIAGKGANGPISWQVDLALVNYLRGLRPDRPVAPRWLTLAEETAQGGPLYQSTSHQWDILMWLADMRH
ncbi:MAG: hypothetical protein ACYC2H_01195 [Thermoplasmatota archaeon]